MVKFKLVSSSKFGIEVLGRRKLGQVWVESDLFTSNWVHGTTDDTKERVDPPSSASAGSCDTKRSDIRHVDDQAFTHSFDVVVLQDTEDFEAGTG
jgi:hypothetical protein